MAGESQHCRVELIVVQPFLLSLVSVLVCSMCVPLPVISLRDDPGFSLDNRGSTTANIQTRTWPGELESLDIWFL